MTSLAADEGLFSDMLESVGIHNFDASVPAVLNEYARRFAAELLCDAQDYAAHAGRTEIEAEDVQIALSFCDTAVAGENPVDSVLARVEDSINGVDLADLLNGGGEGREGGVGSDQPLLHRYPKDALLQRTFTYVPGSEAYDEEEEEKAKTLTGYYDDELPSLEQDPASALPSGSASGGSGGSGGGGSSMKFKSFKGIGHHSRRGLPMRLKKSSSTPRGRGDHAVVRVAPGFVVENENEPEVDVDVEVESGPPDVTNRDTINTGGNASGAADPAGDLTASNAMVIDRSTSSS